MSKDDKPFSPVTLENIAGGALPERLDKAWEDLIANIRDPNTEAEETRKIMIEIAVSPNLDRTKWSARVKVNVKLAGLTPVGDTLYLGKDEDGRVRPFTYDLKQGEMFNESKQADVLPINQTASGAR